MRKYAPAQGEQRYDDAQSYPGRLPVPRRHRRCGRSRLILLSQLMGHRSKNFSPIALQILRFSVNCLMALSCSAVDLFDKSLLHGCFGSLKVFQGLASCL
jgi:hypothetical protein